MSTKIKDIKKPGGRGHVKSNSCVQVAVNSQNAVLTKDAKIIFSRYQLDEYDVIDKTMAAIFTVVSGDNVLNGTEVIIEDHIDLR